MTWFDFITRIFLAVSMGFFIGLERQLTGHLAGIRINVLVCLGTSIFVLFSQVMGALDVTRIAAQIVTGVGFLCSGIIFKDGVNVRGLNTAATIWCTAAIGVLSSSGRMEFAVSATVLLLMSNLFFRLAAGRIKPLACFDESELSYRVTVVCHENREFGVRSMIMSHLAGARLTLVNLESADIEAGRVAITAALTGSGQKQNDIAEKLIERISLEKGVIKAGWELV